MFKVIPYFTSNNISYIKESFPRLQKPCPLVDNKNYSDCQLPDNQYNYARVDCAKVDMFVRNGEDSLNYISDVLKNSVNEKKIVESLYILDRMIDSGVKDIDKMYPVLSRFNNTKSPNIQTYLAGIYRKIQVPEAFGPLVRMLVQNSLNPNPNEYFDPNEEIGGAILSYISDRFRN